MKSKEEEEKDRRLQAFLEQIGSEGSTGDAEKDVLRALMAHPAAIAPLYRTFIDPSPAAVGRLPMLGEIALRVRKAHGAKR